MIMSLGAHPRVRPSHKFGKKITMISSLNELNEFVHLDQIEIPAIVKAFGQ